MPWPMLLAGIVVLLALLARGITQGEFSYNVDETQHACTGQFVADLLRDHPLRHPVDYTYLYYVHYPALSGVLHWPPLFYLWEGVVFLLFGASVVTARLSILILAGLLLWAWFRLLEQFHSAPVAAAGTVLLALCPSMLLFERTVMLEIPSMMLAVAATSLWIRFLRAHRNRDLIGFAALAALAMLTKQNAVYLLLFCVFSLSALRLWRLLRRRTTVVALAVALVLAGPYYGLVSVMHWSSIEGDLAEKQGLVARLTYYFSALPQLVGWPLLAMALVGLATAWWWNRRDNNVLFLCWAASVYVAMTAIGHKEPRYALYLVPTVVYFALWPLLLPRSRPARWFRPAGIVLVGALAVLLAVHAWRWQRPYVVGYAAAARGLRQVTDSGVILVDTKIPANFIFFVRNQDAHRRFVLLRKALYSVRIKDELGGDEYVHTPEQIRDLLRADGIRYLLISSRSPENFPVEGVLRQLVRSPQFRLVRSFPVEGNSPEWDNYSLDLYENLDAGPPTAQSLRTPMMTLDDDIVTPFAELGIPTAALTH